MTINPNQLAVLNLIACDYSYNEASREGDPLATYKNSGISNAPQKGGPPIVS